MSVRFVIGRAGRGKTRHCFDQIAALLRADPLGPPVFWLLPKQATFQAERNLTVELGGFCRARVLSFDQLGREILAECGGSAVPEVTATGRQMLIGRLLRKHAGELQYFRAVADRPGLPAKLDAAFEEFQHSGQSPAELRAALDELSRSTSSDAAARLLHDKLHDLHLLYAAYENYLGQDRFDPHGRMRHVLGCVRQSSRLRGAPVFVDGFYDFTDGERKLLAAIASVAGSVEITMQLDPANPIARDVHHLPDEMGLFHHHEQAYRRLWFAMAEDGVPIGPPIVLTKPRRFRNAALAIIERSLLDGTAEVFSGDPGPAIELVETCDRAAEVDAVSRRIRRHLAAGGRLRDVAMLARDLEDYQELIEASFVEHGIPFFVDRRRAATHHPLIRLVRSAFQIARGGWPHDSAMALLKCGLTLDNLDRADELENYVLTHRIRGAAAWTDPAPWSYQRSTVRAERADGSEPTMAERFELARINETREGLVRRLLPFVGKLHGDFDRPLRDYVLAICELFERFEMRATLGKWISQAAAGGRLEERAEHEQVWSEFSALLDQMADLLGDEPVTPDEFVQILESGLEAFDLALTPPTLDQVLVGQVDRTRLPEIGTVFVLGMAEGQFPATAREDPLLSDVERDALAQRKVQVGRDAERRLLDENLLAYEALTRASRRLVCTRSESDAAGRPLGASSVWRRLRRMFPSLEPTRVPRTCEATETGANVGEQIGTPRQLITGLLRWVRGGAPTGRKDGCEAPWPALYQWLARRKVAEDGDAVDLSCFHAWKALNYHNEAALSPEVARRLFPAPLHASVSRIETFAACPFRHFARYGLRLSDREAQDVTAADLGNVYHRVLEGFVREVLRRRVDWCDVDEQATQEIVQRYAREAGEALRGELMLSSARNRYLLARVERTIAQVIAGQRAASSRGRFRPAYAELGFGVEGGALPPLRLLTPRSREVLLHGKIDRVDLVAEQGTFAVIDYKLSGNALSLHRVYHGIALQLLTYLLVLQAGGEQLTGKKLTPAAAFYVRLLRRLESVEHPDDAPAPGQDDFDLAVKPQGIFDGRCFADLDGACESGKSSVVKAMIRKDGNFGDPDRSDVADTDAFAALLKHVRRRVGELTDSIADGIVSIRPYRIGRSTPCPTCEMRAVCRFEPGVNHYHHLAPLKRSDVLARVVQEASRGS